MRSRRRDRDISRSRRLRSKRSTGSENAFSARDTTDGFVTVFGHILSLFFRDPDGLEAEVCVQNHDAQDGVHNPPGTPAAMPPAGTAPPERLADSPLPT